MQITINVYMHLCLAEFLNAFHIYTIDNKKEKKTKSAKINI